MTGAPYNEAILAEAASKSCVHGVSIASHILLISGYDDFNNSLQLIDPWFGCGIQSYQYDLLIQGTYIESGLGQYVRTFIVD